MVLWLPELSLQPLGCLILKASSCDTFVFAAPYEAGLVCICIVSFQLLLPSTILSFHQA